MSQASGAAPVRFAVQRSKPGGWKTVLVDRDQAEADRVFKGMAATNPRGYFRLIRLEPRAAAAAAGADDDEDADGGGGREFGWRLVALYDPRTGRITGPETPAAPTGPARPPVRPSKATRQAAVAQVSVPVRFYLAVILIGGVLALAAWLALGPAAG